GGTCRIAHVQAKPYGRVAVPVEDHNVDDVSAICKQPVAGLRRADSGQHRLRGGEPRGVDVPGGLRNESVEREFATSTRFSQRIRTCKTAAGPISPGLTGLHLRKLPFPACHAGNPRPRAPTGTRDTARLSQHGSETLNVRQAGLAVLPRREPSLPAPFRTPRTRMPGRRCTRPASRPRGFPPIAMQTPAPPPAAALRD